MTDRSARIDSFLDSAGWADATRAAMVGDLSARRYLRLARNGGTAILMNAPPDKDASTPAFVAMTEWLRGFGLSAPRILAAKPELGLLLLEDLGDLKVSDLVNAGPSERLEIYDTILDLLLLIRAQSVPALPCPKPAALVAMTRLADDHYPGLNTAGILPFRAVLENIFRNLAATAPTVSLRDFHADNLMWLPDREGVARLGLLDYQDAFLTHPVYDLVSLLTDARADVEQALFDVGEFALVGEPEAEGVVVLARAGDEHDARRELCPDRRLHGIPHAIPAREGATPPGPWPAAESSKSVHFEQIA